MVRTNVYFEWNQSVLSGLKLYMLISFSLLLTYTEQKLNEMKRNFTGSSACMCDVLRVADKKGAGYSKSRNCMEGFRLSRWSDKRNSLWNWHMPWRLHKLAWNVFILRAQMCLYSGEIQVPPGFWIQNKTWTWVRYEKQQKQKGRVACSYSEQQERSKSDDCSISKTTASSP